MSLLGFKAESGVIYEMAVIGAIGVAWIYKVSAKPAREEMLPARQGREGGLNEG